MTPMMSVLMIPSWHMLHEIISDMVTGLASSVLQDICMLSNLLINSFSAKIGQNFFCFFFFQLGTQSNKLVIIYSLISPHFFLLRAFTHILSSICLKHTFFSLYLFSFHSYNLGSIVLLKEVFPDPPLSILIVPITSLFHY